MSLSIFTCCITITTISLQNFLIIPTETLYPLKITPLSLCSTSPMVTTIPPSVSMNLPILVTSCKWCHTSFVLCVSGLFLSMMSSSFIHVVVFIRISFFLWLNNTPLYVYITFCLFIHLLMNTWVVSTFLSSILYIVKTGGFVFLFFILNTQPLFVSGLFPYKPRYWPSHLQATPRLL